MFDLQLQVLASLPDYLAVGLAARFYCTLADDGMFEPTKDCLTWEHYEMEDQTRRELVPFSLGRLPDWMLVVQGCFAHCWASELRWLQVSVFVLGASHSHMAGRL